MLSEALTKELNKQVENEFYSASLYLAMSAWAAQNSLPQTAAWLEEQAKEEMEHGMRFYHYILDRGAKAIVPGVQMPPMEFKSVEDVFTQVLEHEKLVTKWVCEQAQMAMAEKDLITWNWIQWVIAEQFEEEKQSMEMLDMVKMYGHNLAIFDHHVKRS